MFTFAVYKISRKQNITRDWNLDHTQIQVQIHNRQNNTSGVSTAQQKITMKSNDGAKEIKWRKQINRKHVLLLQVIKY